MGPRIDPKGFECIVCAAHRLHKIVTCRDTRSKNSRHFRCRVCSVCNTKTSLAAYEQPGVCCPKCMEIRCPVYKSMPIMKRRKVLVDAGHHTWQLVPVRWRVRVCRNPKCGQRHNTVELSESLFC